MREGETKKGVEKARERTVCGRGGANGVLRCFFLTADTFLVSLYCCRTALSWQQLSWSDTGIVSVPPPHIYWWFVSWFNFLEKPPQTPKHMLHQIILVWFDVISFVIHILKWKGCGSVVKMKVKYQHHFCSWLWGNEVYVTLCIVYDCEFTCEHIHGNIWPYWHAKMLRCFIKT